MSERGNNRRMTAIKRQIVVVCFGTPAISGDSLGPEVGSLLRADSSFPAFVYGTLDRPITGKNMGEWMKDGWIYVQTEMNGETSKVKYQAEGMDAFMALYQELLDQSVSQMNGAMLPMIDSITAKTSGGNTVYTLKLNNAVSGMVQDLVGMLGDALPEEVGLDMALELKDCLVGGISVSSYDVEDGGLTVIFPGGIQIGTAEADVLAAYGEADDAYEDAEYGNTYYWYADDSYFNGCTIETEAGTGLVESMSLDCQQ